MLHHSNTFSWFRANQSLLFLLNDACLSKKQQIQISSSVVLGLTRPGLERTAYFTPGEDANHYTSATVILESYIAISYIYRGHKNYRFVI